MNQKPGRKVGAPVDPERLQRALYLNVTPVPVRTWRVNGGADEHIVRSGPQTLQCDCEDAARHPVTACKHRLAVALSRLPLPLLVAFRELVRPPKGSAPAAKRSTPPVAAASS